MNSKSKLGLLMMAYAMMDASFGINNKRHIEEHCVLKDMDTERKRIAILSGHKEFTIDGITVTALNLKNAIKKVNKIKSNS